MHVPEKWKKATLYSCTDKYSVNFYQSNFNMCLVTLSRVSPANRNSSNNVVQKSSVENSSDIGMSRAI